jgi:hypothetical protein
MNGCDCRQYCNRARSRVSDLCKCQAGLADLATEYAAFIADLVGADTMNVTELVQHRALLGENQQQRKNERKAISKSFHSRAKYCLLRLSQRARTTESYLTASCAITRLRRSCTARRLRPASGRHFISISD